MEGTDWKEMKVLFTYALASTNKHYIGNKKAIQELTLNVGGWDTDQTNSGKERVYLAYTSTSQSITEKSRG